MRPAWQADGACAGMPPATFFEDAWDDGNPSRSRRSEGLAKARAVCAGCPVREDCLEYALVNRERFGVWGGLTPPERLELRRGR